MKRAKPWKYDTSAACPQSCDPRPSARKIPVVSPSQRVKSLSENRFQNLNFNRFSMFESLSENPLQSFIAKQPSLGCSRWKSAEGPSPTRPPADISRTRFPIRHAFSSWGGCQMWSVSLRAKRSNLLFWRDGDCFVASLLAMTSLNQRVATSPNSCQILIPAFCPASDTGLLPKYVTRRYPPRLPSPRWYGRS